MMYITARATLTYGAAFDHNLSLELQLNRKNK